MTEIEGYNEALRKIGEEKRLKTGKLEISGLNLTVIPPKIQELLHLEELIFSANKIKEISILKYLINLKDIDGGYNSIESLISFGEHKNLQFISFRNNHLSDLSVLRNDNLLGLYVQNNRIKNIFPLENLSSLRYVNLENNAISFIPYNFIKNNKFELLTSTNSYNFINLNKRINKTIFLNENPLNQEVLTLINSGGRKALLKYFEEKDKTGIVHIKEAKLMLLGMPRAGKSSLKKYLLRESFDPNEKSTEKIDLADWIEEDYKFHIWDFGGQEMLYDLHRFFLTDEALYVIVLDASKDEQPDKYLDFLESYAPNAPFYILINKADIPTSSSKIENYNQIKDKFPNTFKGVFDRVSLIQAHENNPQYRSIAEDVRNKILDTLKALPHISVERPKSYQRVKEEVEAYYEKENAPYINSSTYSALCQEVDVNDEDRSILAFLNVLGTVRYINEPNIRNLHIINPEWAIEAAYFLLTNEEIKNKKGVLNLNQLEILLRSKADSKFTYEIFEIDYLLELLTKFRIIHFHNPSKTIYLPTHFGNDQPKQFKDFRDKSHHYFFEFKADIPGYVISALIAAKFDEIQDHLYWNKGAMLQKDNIKILFEQADKRKIDFWIQGEFFQNYFVEIRTILQEILKPLVGLGFEEKISVTDKGKTIEVKRTHLEKTLKRGREDYEDLDEDIIINAREVLGTYFSKSEIKNLTQNFHGPTNFYNSDTINFWGTEWEELLQT